MCVGVGVCVCGWCVCGWGVKEKKIMKDKPRKKERTETEKKLFKK